MIGFMKKVYGFVAIGLMFQTLVLSESISQQDGSIHNAKTIARITTELALESGPLHTDELTVTVGQQLENNEAKQGWIKRHPVLFGTLIGIAGGAGIGFASGAGYDPNDDLDVGARVLIYGGIGAGIGAGVGALAKKMAEEK